MNQDQKDAALVDMVNWLSHPQELGKSPAKIKCAGEFELHGMHYYLFKYKITIFGKWLLGVCGGYEKDSLEHCGHIFSEMQPYHKNTAIAEARKMVEAMIAYWKKEASQAGVSSEPLQESLQEHPQKNKGDFLGFVLLSDTVWDKGQFLSDLKQKWNLDIQEEKETGENHLVCSFQEDIVAVSLIPTPIPDGEAEENAENNFLWEEAVNVTKTHKAHIMVTVIGKSTDILERGKLFTKILSACCEQQNAIGVYTSGTVFEPHHFVQCADMMKEGLLPIFNWIWFGLYRGKQGICGYTYGMDIFGKEEMEVLEADTEPSKLILFLADLASYVLEEDVNLQDGETIGFSKEDKHLISFGEGVALEKNTLKITF